MLGSIDDTQVGRYTTDPPTQIHPLPPKTHTKQHNTTHVILVANAPTPARRPPRCGAVRVRDDQLVRLPQLFILGLWVGFGFGDGVLDRVKVGS